jgi:hypothetical protein
MYALKGRDERRQGTALAQISDSAPLGGKNFCQLRCVLLILTIVSSGKAQLHHTEMNLSSASGAMASRLPRVQDVSDFYHEFFVNRIH